MKTIIKSSAIISPQGLTSGYIVMQGGKISGIVTGTCPKEPGDTFIDVGTLYVSPGFIDIHTHGAGGYDFMDGTVEAIVGAANAHMQHGTTALVPTALTCSDEELFRLYDCYSQAKALACGPELLGLHLEGPYFAASQRGAQDPTFLKIPTPEHVDYILNGCADIVRVSAAPELPFGMELGENLRKRNILASIGHSDANYSQVKEAVLHGYAHVTHLYSGMSTLHREGPYRKLGVVESAYLEDALSVEIIADGIHLPPELLRLILRCKSHEKICLITDSMRGAGMQEGIWVKLGSKENGQEVLLKDGVAMLADLKAFAGSTCTADRCIRTIYNLGELDICDTVKLMTYNPARILGISHKKGSLQAGMDADLCIFDDSIKVMMVLIGGKIMINNL